MRLETNMALVWHALTRDAEGKARKVSDNIFWGEQTNLMYHAYPRFLLRCMNEQMLEKLYLPWELADGYEPLHVHIANTHHWKLTEVRLMQEDELLAFLRPELRQLTLPSSVIDALVKATGDILPEEVMADLLGRRLNAPSSPEKSSQ